MAILDGDRALSSEDADDDNDDDYDDDDDDESLALFRTNVER